MNEHLKALVNQYRMMWNSHTVGRWRFATQLMLFRDEYPDVSTREIGTALAKAVLREKPYSNAWITGMVMAARKFPNEPKTEMERRQFNAAVQRRKVLRPTKEFDRAQAWNQKDRCVRGVASLAVRAMQKGATVDEIVQAVVAALQAHQKGANAA